MVEVIRWRCPECKLDETVMCARLADGWISLNPRIPTDAHRASISLVSTRKEAVEGGGNDGSCEEDE